MRTAFRILIILGLVHLAGLVATPHIANRLLKMKVSEICRECRRNSDSYIEGRILEYAAEKKIPLTGRNVHVWRQSDRLKVVIDYDRTVAIPFRPYDVRLQVAIPPDAAPPGYHPGRR